jgi:ribosomal protein S18 acetylase RimI-like enzyme
MIVRQAGEADLEALRALEQELRAEGGASPLSGRARGPGGAGALRAEGTVLIAEEGGEVLGYACLRFSAPDQASLEALYVRSAARRRGVGRRLVAEAAALARSRAGSARIAVAIAADDRQARAFYERLGFSACALVLSAPAQALEARGQLRAEPSRGRVYVQTDDVGAVERMARSYLPRLGRSAATRVGGPCNGWVEVEDELCSRDPRLLRRLAQELSYRSGGVVLLLGLEEGQLVRYVLFDRGSVAGEYASLPEYYGPLAPGDVVALAANPRVAARLAGVDPGRLREVARTASRPEELPPPAQLYAELASVFGVSPAP